MITSTYNNIGIEQVSFQAYESENLTILQGKFSVDPSSAAWQSASEIVFKFSSLVMSKSCMSQVYMRNSREDTTRDKGFRGTMLKSWFQNGELHIEKTDYFDGNGLLVFYVCSAYMTGAQRGIASTSDFVATGITNQPADCRTTLAKLLVKPGYVYGLYVFEEFYGVDGGLEQSFDITAIPSEVDVYVPVFYHKNVDNTGAVIAEGHIQNGHFSCTNPDSITHYANSGVFFMFFAVRNNS